MGNLYEEESGVFAVLLGANIKSTIKEAIKLSSDENRIISFCFNDVLIAVKANSDSRLIYRDWIRAIDGYVQKEIVGPYPKRNLAIEERRTDAWTEARNELRRNKLRAEYAIEACEKRKALEAKLKSVPNIALVDERDWNDVKENNKEDPWSSAILTYAERWARFMQFEMDNGSKLEDVAESTSQEADLEGISGYMYGRAVSVLVHYWRYGEQLRIWHNLSMQVGNEGERANANGTVLNPALLSVSREL